MEVVLLGTGSADGWPNPFCRCRSCESARQEGLVRGQTAALVDGVLLLDCGPEAPRAAARAGRVLDGVTDIFLTHSHPDHTGPAALLWRSWAGVGEMLTVHGPAQAIEECRPWLGPDDSVRLVPVDPGHVVETAHHRVRALAANHGDEGSGPGLLWDVTDQAGHRLLYATDTGWPPGPTLETMCAAEPYDLVLLEETFGERAELGDDHLHLATFGSLLDELRDGGSVTSDTQVVAVHLSHHNPEPDILQRRLAEFGARPGRDGEVLATQTPGARDHARTTLVLGGARSGKSAVAERLVACDEHVTYVATGGRRDDDPEWVERVARHRARRPSRWRTVETTDVAGILDAAAGADALLVDCATLWLTAVLDRAGAWSTTATGHGSWQESVVSQVDDFVAALSHCPARVVIVSNEVGQGVVPMSPAGRRFRDELGVLNVRLAQVADRVVLVTAGLPTVIKGPPCPP